jgi:hypothetical protein
MLRWTGRLGLRAAGHGGRLLHVLLELALALAVLLAAASGGLAWRLSQGPLELGWLARRIEAATTADLGAPRIRIGSAALAWEGFHGGVDRPLDLRLTGLRAYDAQGVERAGIPQADVSLSIGALLLGRLIPRAIAIDGANLVVLRGRDGTVSLDLGGPAPEPAGASQAATGGDANPFNRVLAELERAPRNDLTGGLRGDRLGQMQRLLIRDSRVSVVDQQLGAVWRAPRALIDLRRQPGGGVAGTLDLELALGQATARLTATAGLAAGGTTAVQAHLSPVTPAVLAGAAPVLRPLAAVDAPVTLDATLTLGQALAIRTAGLTATLAAGTVRAGSTGIAMRGGALELAADPAGMTLKVLRLVLPSPGGGADSVILLAGRLRRQDGKLRAEVTGDIDHLALADLPALWPEEMAHAARAWVVPNVTGGMARQGHVAAALDVADDLSDATLTGLSGGISGSDVTVWWLRPIPPVVHGQATLTLDNPDSMTIAFLGGQQSPPGALMLRGGGMHITGLSQHQQTGALTVDLAGPVADALGILRQPRLHLFDRLPLTLREPSGTATARLTVALPLTDKVRTEQIQVTAHAHLSDVHLGGIVAGRNLDRGEVELDVDNDGLAVAGQAALAGIPASLKGSLDFRAGGPGQVVEQVSATARADERQLSQAGLDSAGLLVGPVAVAAVYAQHRDGSAEVSARADIAAAAMGLTALGWRKPPGMPASASARILLRHDRIVGVDSLRADGEGLLVRGSADYADGRPDLLRLDQVVLGQTHAHGQVQFPAAAGQPIRVSLQGPVLDLAARLEAPAAPHPRPPASDTGGPAWDVQARFDQVLGADHRPLGAVSAEAASDGHVVTRARLEAAGAGHAVAEIVPDAPGRRLSVRAGDAGALLRALGVTGAVLGGRLDIAGRYDDTAPGHPLAGVARLDEYSIGHAPVIGKVLQAMTLYGLADALHGPGLQFAQAVVPFRLDRDWLELREARMSSPSLGMTAHGRLDLAARTIDLRGTIVPAYFFNTLLGNVPLVGRLFSPEKDGGVFSATYALSGRLDDPSVSVNPLAALTPGFLRGVFGMFDQGTDR